MKQFILKIALIIGVGIPMPVFAVKKDLNYLVNLIVQYINVFVYLIISLGVLIFVWNIYKYFIASDPENKKEAGTYVMYSVIGFFVILSFWGFVNILTNTLNLDTAKPPGAGGASGVSNTSPFNNSNQGGGNTGTVDQYNNGPLNNFNQGGTNVGGQFYNLFPEPSSSTNIKVNQFNSDTQNLPDTMKYNKNTQAQ